MSKRLERGGNDRNDVSADQSGIAHPFDTPLSSGFRFLSEIIAWIAGSWAAGLIHPAFAMVALVVLVGLPTVFTTKSDKRHMVVDTPEPGRVLVEMVQYLVAAIVPWLVWPNLLALACVLVVIASHFLGLPRTRWLLRGAPPGG